MLCLMIFSFARFFRIRFPAFIFVKYLLIDFLVRPLIIVFHLFLCMFFAHNTNFYSTEQISCPNLLHTVLVELQRE